MSKTMYLVIGLVIFIPSFLVFIYNYAGWIYLDAKSREMKPRLWTLIGLSGQNMGGFLIYLIARKGKIQMETKQEVSKVKRAAISFCITSVGIIFCMLYLYLTYLT